MIVPSRRLFLSGGAAMIAAPLLVRAESLDAVFRGYQLDPWILGFRTGFPERSPRYPYCLSQYDRKFDDSDWGIFSNYHYRFVDDAWRKRFRAFNLKERAAYLNEHHPLNNTKYEVIRSSDLEARKAGDAS